MPGMLPGMQALTTIIYIWLAAVLHVLPVVELCACLPGLGVPAHGGGALVVGITKVPLPGAPNSMHHGAAVAQVGNCGLGGVAGGACHPCIVASGRPA